LGDGLTRTSSALPNRRQPVQRGLVDEFVLMIHPLVLGTGRRLFADGGAFAELELTDTTTTTTGVVIARYRAAPHTEG
jgi:dihydrofolate reductase